MDTDAKAVPRRGLVAVFDILGYREFIKANDIGYQIEALSSVMDRVPEETIKVIQEHRLDLPNGGELEWRIFSDLIVFSIPMGDLPQSGTVYEHAFADDMCHPPLFRMLTACGVLLRMMFDQGFPLRGSVAFGDYFVSDRWLAGAPLVEAYEASAEQNWSGCALSEGVTGICERLMRSAEDKRRDLGAVTFEYVVPTKGKVSATRRVCNWAAEGAPKVFVPNIGHPRDYVMAAFSKHGKTVGESVLDKVSNTEAFIWYCRGIVARDVKS